MHGQAREQARRSEPSVSNVAQRQVPVVPVWQKRKELGTGTTWNEKKNNWKKKKIMLFATILFQFLQTSLLCGVDPQNLAGCGRSGTTLLTYRRRDCGRTRTVGLARNRVLVLRQCSYFPPHGCVAEWLCRRRGSASLRRFGQIVFGSTADLLSYSVRRNSRIGQSGLLCSLSERPRREPTVQVRDETHPPSTTILTSFAFCLQGKSDVPTNVYAGLTHFSKYRRLRVYKYTTSRGVIAVRREAPSPHDAY